MYLLEDIHTLYVHVKNFVAFGLILWVKPQGFGPIDLCVNQTSHKIYILKSSNGVPVAAQRLVHKLGFISEIVIEGSIYIQHCMDLQLAVDLYKKRVLFESMD